MQRFDSSRCQVTKCGCMKKKFLPSGLSIFFLLLFCIACNKEYIKPNTPANYFPNAVGDTWEYDVTDSSHVLMHPNFPRHLQMFGGAENGF